jgi:hypothetical protein
MLSERVVAISRKFSYGEVTNTGTLLELIKEEVRRIKQQNSDLHAYRLDDVGLVRKGGALRAKLYFTRTPREKYAITL